MSSLPASLRVGVVRGGPSPEYDVSLKTGNTVLQHLSETHAPLDIFIDKEGRWHMHGVARSPEKILKNVDVIWNALHGAYGEDGGIQEFLDHHGVPYTGSARLPSALAMNKWMTKERAYSAGIRTPLHVVIRQTDPIREKATEIFYSIPHPLVVKPVTGGSSLGLYMVQNLAELLAAVEAVLSAYDAALVEEYISGKEGTCGVIENFRGQKAYALPPVEIIPPPGKSLFDHYAKYSGESRELCPGNFSSEEKMEIERLAALVHETLGLSHYSRSDFIVSPRRGIYFLEVNTLPGLTDESLLPKSLDAVGVSMKEFIHHILGLAIGKK